MSKKKLSIYCESVAKKGAVGYGWGAVIVDNDSGDKIERFGRVVLRDGQIAELTSLVQSLKEAKNADVIQVFTGSTYLAKGVLDWLPNWVKKGFKTAKGGEVAHKELWMTVDHLINRRRVNFKESKDEALTQRAVEIALAA